MKITLWHINSPSGTLLYRNKNSITKKDMCRKFTVTLLRVGKIETVGIFIRRHNQTLKKKVR